MTEDNYQEVLQRDRVFIRGRVSFYNSLRSTQTPQHALNLLTDISQALGRAKHFRDSEEGKSDLELERWTEYLRKESEKLRSSLEAGQNKSGGLERAFIPKDARIELNDETGT